MNSCVRHSNTRKVLTRLDIRLANVSVINLCHWIGVNILFYHELMLQQINMHASLHRSMSSVK